MEATTEKSRCAPFPDVVPNFAKGRIGQNRATVPDSGGKDSQFKSLKLFYHRFHRFWLRVVDAISQICYWITAANAAMMKSHGICEIPNNRGDNR